MREKLSLQERKLLEHHETELCSPSHRFGPTVRIELGENGSDVKLSEPSYAKNAKFKQKAHRRGAVKSLEFSIGDRVATLREFPQNSENFFEQPCGRFDRDRAAPAAPSTFTGPSAGEKHRGGQPAERAPAAQMKKIA